MTDHRPQYGELATPEEQRAAAGLPPVQELPPVVVEPQGPTAPAVPATGAPRRPVDRLVTIGLLVYGLINAIVTAVSYLDLPRVMNETMKIVGIEGEFTNFAQGKLWGTIAAILLVVGWGITAAVSVRRLRRGKLTWWVPLVGAVVTMTIVTICIAVPMMGDPAFIAHLDALTS
ncbi:MAG: DUF6264 family protein [Candidatus Microbacterium colombiense]|nr:MAG: DUF6264 family protein [Microbacterium sp.]